MTASATYVVSQQDRRAPKRRPITTHEPRGRPGLNKARGKIDIVAAGGDPYLGGTDFDNMIASWLEARLQQTYDVDDGSLYSLRRQLLSEAERAKRFFCASDRASLSAIVGGKCHEFELTREQFEFLTSDLTQRTISLCEEVLRDSGLSWRDIDRVILAGGSSRMESVFPYVRRHSGLEPWFAGEDAVARGAATSAWLASHAEHDHPVFQESSCARQFFPPAAFELGPLETVDEIWVRRGEESARVEFCVGDVTNIRPEDAADVLIVSAFPDEYTPMPYSLTGALHRRGISLAALAHDKEVDLRHAFSCWLSRAITDLAPPVQFKRVLCFEPYRHGTPAERVGDIFRSLAPFVGAPPEVRSIATSLVATGYQGAVAEQMLQLLVDAAVHWIQTGLPLRRVRIACLPGRGAERLRSVFTGLKQKHAAQPHTGSGEWQYHIFISYSHSNGEEARWLVDELLKRRQDLRLFMDRLQLDPGTSWQQRIFESLDHCAKVVALLSPAYINSKVCLEEFNIALYRQREASATILIPIYLYSADLPTYMKVTNYVDCREFDRQALSSAVDLLT